ncbi:hypothetical protein QO034_01105 [Sedimentitalea sp. JM2-8]|uniref:Flagellar FliJ protein n=1 Tax=Sedimentitalea xiamensis TaxID=3050037 RepID=A0ABT7F9B3_9RHOB|nr:hypothetical protein [Sedimentitalea xiamensis]MDK3071695.1 hypothetical protein [Sedimentitalea xiamensis]
MKQDKLGQMADVTHAVYLNEFQKVRGILEEESRLRQQLARVKDQSRQGREDMKEDVSMRSVGADLLWQAWLTRTQRQLNIELSQVMARKLTAMGRVRRAFGRQNAVAAMHETRKDETEKARRRKAFELLIQNSSIG